MEQSENSGEDARIRVRADDIAAYLECIRESQVLGRSKRRFALLEYLIDREVAGEGPQLKAYAIGLDIFEKPKSFDPSTDSSVRVEIGRLRERLTLFEGQHNTTRIKVEIPVGTYRPKIEVKADRAVATTTTPESAEIGSYSAPPRSLSPLVAAATGAVVALVLAAAVFGFMITGEKSADGALPSGPHPIVLTVQDFAGEPFSKEISSLVRRSLLNYSSIKVLDEVPEEPKVGYFVLRGTISSLGESVLVSVALSNQIDGEVVWTKLLSIDPGRNLPAQVDQKLNGELVTRLVGATKRLFESYEPEDLTPQQLFILATWVSGPAESSLAWETRRVDLMKIALEKDPDYGPAHSVLADKYGFLANVHPAWDTPENQRLSLFHAERAAELSPLDPGVMFNVAQSHWHAGRHRKSKRLFERTKELDSGNTLAVFFARVMPYWCAIAPDDEMEWAMNFDRALSPDDPVRWIILTWIATMHANRGEYELALAEVAHAAQIFQVGYTYMAHAMLLNKLGNADAAAEVIRRQRNNWPLIGAERYASSTVPRQCKEQPNPEKIIADYRELAEAMSSRLAPARKASASHRLP